MLPAVPWFEIAGVPGVESAGFWSTARTVATVVRARGDKAIGNYRPPLRFAAVFGFRIPIRTRFSAGGMALFSGAAPASFCSIR